MLIFYSNLQNDETVYRCIFFLILGFPNLPCTQVCTKTKPFQTEYNENKKLYDRQTDQAVGKNRMMVQN